ncbi:hypothetical protein MHF_0683 [Mycoplasma haemofelis Ohio2]|uniref:Uncharacterized protein n=1 Tax=Mycoplasma haemofelis (strain Ohio2) TaxID=859194 RepID=F6FIA5_MYCHI|nr:hypothetical protein MHF_0683 [Mycoplasma haemofelis Ohio2]
MLDWFSKLLLGGSVLAGTGVSLGISTLTSKDTKLVTSEESIGLAVASHDDEDLYEEEPEVTAEVVKEKEVVKAKIETPKLAPQVRKGCTIHQLNSSSKPTWSISLVGTLEQFLDAKSKRKEDVNRTAIKNKCDSSNGKDILVINKRLGWYYKQWDYSEEYQNNNQFNSYLARQKR